MGLFPNRLNIFLATFMSAYKGRPRAGLWGGLNSLFQVKSFLILFYCYRKHCRLRGSCSPRSPLDPFLSTYMRDNFPSSSLWAGKWDAFIICLHATLSPIPAYDLFFATFKLLLLAKIRYFIAMEGEFIPPYG